MALIRALLLALSLSGCASLNCGCPLADTAGHVANLDFTERADGAVLRCKTHEYLVGLKLVRAGA